MHDKFIKLIITTLIVASVIGVAGAGMLNFKEYQGDKKEPAQGGLMGLPQDSALINFGEAAKAQALSEEAQDSVGKSVNVASRSDNAGQSTGNTTNTDGNTTDSAANPVGKTTAGGPLLGDSLIFGGTNYAKDSAGFSRDSTSKVADSAAIKNAATTTGNTATADSSAIKNAATTDTSAVADSTSKKLLPQKYRKPKIDTTRKPFLDAPIFGKSTDSLVYDVALKNIYIHKGGHMTYQDIELDGDYIRMNTVTKLVHADGIEDTTTKIRTRPVFTQGAAKYELDSMNYNMTSGKAQISGVNTKEGEGIIYGGKVKKMKDNVIHMHNGRYTTCDAACPHFYLQMTKGTVVPNKKTVFGPAYMVFEDVPFYVLGLPFGFFPQNNTRSSGIIIPDIGEEVIKGFYLRDGGYFWAINDYVDLTIRGGIYTLGSWQLSGGSNYVKRYKFQGALSVNYAKDIIGEKGSSDYVNTSNMQVRWTHRQDPKASPNSSFAANVDYSTSSYNKYNASLNDYLNSQINSSISYSKSWAGKPISLGVNASLGQNTRDSTVALTIPSFSFNVQRISPFKRKNPVGKERWYEKISFTYQAQLDNKVTVKESQLFKPEMFEKMQYAIKHTIPISASFNVLKYLNLSPSFNFTDRMYFKKVDKEWNQEKGRVEIADTTNGFYNIYDFNVSLSANTKLYGTYTVGRKKPTIIRHVLTPTISATYTPDFSKSMYGFYKTIQVDEEGKTDQYSPFANEMYGVPGRGESASLNFSLGNTLEMKVPCSPEKDTTGYKKLKIFESLSIASSYNFLADSLRLAPFTVSARTTIVKGLSLQIGATFDPYQIDANGRKINQFLVNKGGFLRMTNLNFNFGYGFTGGEGSKTGQAAINNPSNNQNNTPPVAMDEQGNFFQQTPQQNTVDKARQLASQYYDFNIPWSLSFNYTFNYTKPGKAKATIMQTINFNASVSITEKWGVSTSAGYDFQLKQLTPGAITITRDLHCWQMNFTWIPIGFRQSWNFTIQARSSMLADVLKYKKDRSFLDNYYNQ